MSTDIFDSLDLRAWLRELVAERTASGDPLALAELVAVAGLSQAHLSNLLSGSRRLSLDLAPGLGMAARLDMHGSAHLLLLARLSNATSSGEAHALIEAIHASRERQRELLARGLALTASPIPHAVVEAIRYALPVMRWRSALPDRLSSLSALMRPTPGTRIVRRALQGGGSVPSPCPLRWLPEARDPLGQRLHALGLRRLAWSIPRLGREEAETLGLTATVSGRCWAMFRGHLRAALERALAPVLEAGDRGPRQVMWVGAQVQPLSQVVEGDGSATDLEYLERAPAGPGTMSPLRYDDAISWLRDAVAARLARNRHLTITDLAERLGTNPSNMAAALRGERKLPVNVAVPLGAALKLSPVEAEAARLLLELQHVRRSDTRARLLERLAELRAGAGVLEESSERFLLFTRWEHLAILALAGCAGFRGDPDWLARALCPPIPVESAESALLRLRRLGLVVNEGGRLRPSGAALFIPEHLRSEVYVQQFLRRGEIALRALSSPEGRVICDGCLVSVPASRADEVLRALRLVQAEVFDLLDTLARQEPGDQVGHFLLHASPYTFPLPDSS